MFRRKHGRSLTKVVGTKTGLVPHRENKPLTRAVPLPKPKVGLLEFTPLRPSLAHLHANEERWPSKADVLFARVPPVPICDLDGMDSSSCDDAAHVNSVGELLPPVAAQHPPSPSTDVITSANHKNCSLLTDTDSNLEVMSPRRVGSAAELLLDASVAADSENGRQSTPKRPVSMRSLQMYASGTGDRDDLYLPQRSASTPSSDSPVVQSPFCSSFDSNPGSPSTAPRELVESLSGRETCSGENDEKSSASQFSCSASRNVDMDVDMESGSEDYSFGGASARPPSHARWRLCRWAQSRGCTPSYRAVRAPFVRPEGTSSYAGVHYAVRHRDEKWVRSSLVRQVPEPHWILRRPEQPDAAASDDLFFCFRRDTDSSRHKAVQLEQSADEQSEEVQETSPRTLQRPAANHRLAFFFLLDALASLFERLLDLNDRESF